MSLLPTKIYNKLLSLPVDEWRSLRATMRWRYTNADRTPPPILKSAMTVLWSDPRVWKGIAKEITAKRTKAAAKLRYMNNVRKKKEAAEKKRAYMKTYMEKRRKAGKK